MAQDRAKLSDMRVLAALDRIEYPASKQDVIGEAEARGASQNFLEDLQALDRMGFSDREDLEEALRQGDRLTPNQAEA